MLAPRLIRRYRPRSVITGGLALITLALFAVSFSHGFYTPLALYFLVGMGTGFANIPTMALISHWFRSDQRGLRGEPVVHRVDGLCRVHPFHCSARGLGVGYPDAGWRNSGA